MIIIFIALGYLCYWLAVPAAAANLTAEGILLLFVTILLVYWHRRHTPYFILSLFLASANYSIAMTFFLSPEVFSFPLQEAVTLTNLATGARLLTLLTLGLFLLPRSNLIEFPKPIRADVFYVLLVLLLIYVTIFEFQRGGGNGVYSVRITPIYEYTPLFVMIAYYVSGDLRAKRVLLLGISCILIVQDVLYGGRITTLQLLIVLAITIFRTRLTPLVTLALAALGSFALTLVGVARSSAGPQGFFDSLQTYIGTKLMVSDTAQYAFYASLTHIHAAEQATSSEKLSTFMDLLNQVIFGGGSDLTRYVSANFYVNVGGGMFPSHFFFWGGYAAAALGILSLILIAHSLSKSNRAVIKLVSCAVIVTSPRWVMYAPSALYRPIFLLLVFVAFASAFGLLRARGVLQSRPKQTPFCIDEQSTHGTLK